MTWFRFYADALNNPKVQLLPGDVFKTWVNLLCLARKSDGKLPTTLAAMAFALRIAEAIMSSHLEELIQRGLIDRTADGLMPHEWNQYQYDSDNVTARVHRYRQKQKQRNVSETLPETLPVTDCNVIEQIQNRTDTEQIQRNTSGSTAKPADEPSASTTAPQSANEPAQPTLFPPEQPGVWTEEQCDAFLKEIQWKPRDITQDHVAKILAIDFTKITQVLWESPNSLAGIYTRLKAFENRFWPKFWRKVAVKSAREAFLKAAVSIDVMDEIIEGMEKQLPSMLRREKEVRPHATTWLNQERWNDPVEEEKIEWPHLRLAK